MFRSGINRIFVSLLICAVALPLLSRAVYASGGIDPTFSASVTEGVGSVLKTVVQPDGKIVAFATTISRALTRTERSTRISIRAEAEQTIRLSRSPFRPTARFLSAEISPLLTVRR
jgi:hypothetical protein